MTENEFLVLTDGILATIQQTIDDTGLDADPVINEGVLEIAFDNGEQIVINRHLPSRELWIATRHGGFHFSWQNNQWLNTRDHSELFTVLAKMITAAAGAAFQFPEKE